MYLECNNYIRNYRNEENIQIMRNSTNTLPKLALPMFWTTEMCVFMLCAHASILGLFFQKNNKIF